MATFAVGDVQLAPPVTRRAGRRMLPASRGRTGSVGEPEDLR